MCSSDLGHKSRLAGGCILAGGLAGFLSGTFHIHDIVGDLEGQPHLETAGAHLLDHRGALPAKDRARAAADGGVVAVLEPLNTKVDHAGYFLDHAVDAFRLVREINAPALRVLYDIYHMQIMDGDLIATIEANLDLISHFHVADVPGRHEPGTGEINYANVFRRIDAAGYAGFVGLEFRPSGDHDAALASVRALVA